MCELILGFQCFLMSAYRFYYQIIMMNNEDEGKIQSNDQVLEKLNQLYIEMERLPNITQQLLRSYVGLYVRRHSLSQDFFSALCQHSIVHKLFGHQTKHLPSVILLEIFNLLLANTSQQNNLIFIFSQSILHQFLFQRFDPFNQSVEAVEYYVQLLKTIILKISSHGNNSLIKLFCNNRFPSFPLLSVAVTLATAYCQEQLVRVTACQCVLQIIALINQKKVGRGYLTDLQMAIFFYELTVRMREQINQEGHLKYVIDLLYALRNNPISLSLLFSAFTNNVILPMLDDLPSILKMLRNLNQHIEEHGLFPKDKFVRIKRVFLNILSAFYFSKFTNSTYMASLKIINFTKITQPNLLKYYQKRGQKIGFFLLQYDEREESQDEKVLIYENWVDFNCNSQEIQKIKDGKIRRSNFFSNFFIKPDPQQQYIRRALTSIGLNYDQLRFPLFKFLVSINMKTCIYIIQQSITLRELRGQAIDREKQEAHLSDYKGKFQLSKQMCTEVLFMIKRLEKHNILMTDLMKKCPAEVQFQYGFLCRLRNYLLHTLSDYLLVVEKDLSLHQIALIRQAITLMGIFPLLDIKIRKKLVWKLEELQQEINDLAFNNDFKKLIGYVIDNKQEQFLKLFDQNNEPTSPSPKSLVEFKTFKYEFIRKIIDPSLESISQFVNRQWCQSMSIEEIKSLTFNFTFQQKGSIILKPTNMGIFLILKPSQDEKQWKVKIKQDDPKINAKTLNCLQFQQLAYFLQMRSKDEAYELRTKIQKIRSYRQERVTKLIVQYFEITYNKIRDSVLHRIK